MSTDDKVATVVVSEKKKGRPAKVDKTTPMGDYIAEEAKKSRERKTKNHVVAKYYELVAGTKLVLCKKVASGTVHKTLIGHTTDKKSGDQIKAFMKRIEAEGKLRVKV
jgi:hypothetical protein